MGPLYNFGSLLAGVPDWSQRQATTALTDPSTLSQPNQLSALLSQLQQQQAYNAANGGTYLGGLINASYATPQTGLQPGSQIAGQVAAATGPSAVSGAYTPSTNYAAPTTQTQPSGWGGPFTGKNPWALS